ncbi:MAG: hypothetical protein Aurels2KO_32270 [Aureliella sp.]
MPFSPTSTASQARCLSADRIEAFLEGALSDAQLDSIGGHLEVCATCRQTLEDRTSLQICAELDDEQRNMLTQLSPQSGSPVNVRLKQSGLIGPTHRPGVTPDTSPRAADSTRLTSSSGDGPPSPKHEPQVDSLARIPQLDGYEILEPLAAGGMGQVFRARQHSLGRDVALKFLSTRQTGEARQRFRREAEAVGSLDHENVVRAFDAGEVDGLPYLVMQLLEGRDLADQLRSDGPLDVPAACRLMVDAARGLHAAHEAGLVHRDVKPGNLMLTDDGCLKVLDLGLVSSDSTRPRLASTPADGALTSAGSIMGSTDYISPEQATDTNSSNAQSDIYGLGCTLFTLLAGQPPFDAFQRTARKLIAHAQSDRPDVRLLRPDVPKDLAEYIQKMMAVDPDQRPESMQQVAQALAGFGDKGPAKRPLSMALIGAGGAAFVALLSFIVITFRDGSEMTIETDKPVSSLKLTDGDQVVGLSVDGVKTDIKDSTTAGQELLQPSQVFPGHLAAYHEDTIVGVGFGASNREAFVVVNDGRILLWDSQQPDEQPVVIREGVEDRRIGRIAISVPEQNALLYGWSEGLVLMDLETKQPLWTSPGSGNIEASRVPGTDLLVHSRLRFTSICSLEDGKPLMKFLVSSNSRPAVSSDGRWLAIVQRKIGNVHLYDLQADDPKETNQVLTPPRFEATDAAFSPDGQHVIAVGGARWAVWNIKSGEIIYKNHTAHYAIHDVVRRIGETRWYATLHGQLRDRLKIWDPMTGEIKLEQPIPSSYLLTISSDGTHALTSDFADDKGQYGNNIRLWDLSLMTQPPGSQSNGPH